MDKGELYAHIRRGERYTEQDLYDYVTESSFPFFERTLEMQEALKLIDKAHYEGKSIKTLENELRIELGEEAEEIDNRFAPLAELGKKLAKDEAYINFSKLSALMLRSTDEEDQKNARKLYEFMSSHFEGSIGIHEIYAKFSFIFPLLKEPKLKQGAKKIDLPWIKKYDELNAFKILKHKGKTNAEALKEVLPKATEKQARSFIELYNKKMNLRNFVPKN